MIQKEIKLLGFKAKDKVTGFQGVITSISFDLYGCIQALLSSAKTKDGKVGESYWMDTNRLEIISKNPVMKCRHTFEKNDIGSNSLPKQRLI